MWRFYIVVSQLGLSMGRGITVPYKVGYLQSWIFFSDASSRAPNCMFEALSWVLTMSVSTILDVLGPF